MLEELCAKRLLAGQTLIQVVVAIALCSIILVAVTKIIVSSFTNVVFSESQVNDSNLSQDAMAYMGSLQESDLTTFNTFSGSYYFGSDKTLSPISSCFTGSSPSTPNVGINPTNLLYVRMVKITPNNTSSSNTTEVDATTYWNDNTCGSNKYCHNSSLVTCYSAPTTYSTPIPSPVCGTPCTTNADCTNPGCSTCIKTGQDWIWTTMCINPALNTSGGP